MKHEHVLINLYPPVSYNRKGKHFLVQAKIDGHIFDALFDSQQQVINALTPHTSGRLLKNWERVCGIPTDINQSYQQRVNRVILQLNALGGLSLPYFIRLAESIGYQIKIKEFSYQANDLPNVGDIPINNSPKETLGFMWRVDVLNSNNHSIYFRAGQSLAGERLISFGDPILETFFKDLKPAHSYCYFAYKDNHEINH